MKINVNEWSDGKHLLRDRKIGVILRIYAHVNRCCLKVPPLTFST